ncbi:MAG: putative sulfate exporter family transporter [candidate division NC10 bacterium]|nr:putative sulfate exporter family transporter [candidate division NC10 bacterium]
MGYLPGLGLLLLLAVPALWLQERITVSGKPVISAVALVILFGLALRNSLGLPERCKPGAGLAVKRVLRIGIVLMGAQLSLGEVFRGGGQVLLIIALCITLAILTVRRLSLALGLSERLGTLIGVGTSICGVSAIVATSPVIGAKEEETALAVGTITACGLLALLVYPLLGAAWGLSDRFFGTWAGTAVNDTSQVVATGLMFSQRAAEVATVVKLTRNLFMAPVILLLSGLYLRRTMGGATGEPGQRRRALQSAVPFFVLGFLGMALLNSLGLFGPPVREGLRSLSVFLILLGIGGVGLETDLAAVRRIGFRPFYAGLAAAVLMAGVSFGLIVLTGIR